MRKEEERDWCNIDLSDSYQSLQSVKYMAEPERDLFTVQCWILWEWL